MRSFERGPLNQGVAGLPCGLIGGLELVFEAQSTRFPCSELPHSQAGAFKDPLSVLPAAAQRPLDRLSEVEPSVAIRVWAGKLKKGCGRRVQYVRLGRGYIRRRTLEFQV
jgi:hypothetical protein